MTIKLKQTNEMKNKTAKKETGKKTKKRRRKKGGGKESFHQLPNTIPDLFLFSLEDLEKVEEIVCVHGEGGG